MKNSKLNGLSSATLLCALILGLPNTLYAQQAPIGFSAETAIAAGTDSNVLRLSDDETSDTILEVAPELNFVELYGKHKFSAKYEGNYVRFSDFDNFNYSDHKTTLKTKLEHTIRFKTELEYNYEDVVELPGINDSVTQELEEYNNVNQHGVSIKGTYGRDDAAGQIVIGYDFRERTYNNNNQGFRDYDFNRIVATGYYRVAPNTRLVFEISNADLTYKANIFNPGSQYTNYLIGAEWSPSVKTRGVFKIGQQDQNFDNPEFNDISGLAYFADLYWKPNTFSLVKLGARRSTRESSEVGVGSFITTEFSVNTEHDFTPSLSISGSYSYGEDDVVIGNDVTLERQQLEFNLIHKSASLFHTYIGLKYFSRDSEQTIYNVKASEVKFGIIGYFGSRKNK